MNDYKLKIGCRPCNFYCDCCLLSYYRCATGILMYYKGDEMNPTRILCEKCYDQCSNATCVNRFQ